MRSKSFIAAARWWSGVSVLRSGDHASSHFAAGAGASCGACGCGVLPAQPTAPNNNLPAAMLRQLMAADAARENIEGHYRATVASHDALVSAFVALRDDEQKAVAHFGETLARANGVAMHPALVTQRRRCVLDYAGGEERLREEAVALATRSEALHAKVH